MRLFRSVAEVTMSIRLLRVFDRYKLMCYDSAGLGQFFTVLNKLEVAQKTLLSVKGPVVCEICKNIS